MFNPTSGRKKKVECGDISDIIRQQINRIVYGRLSNCY